MSAPDTIVLDSDEDVAVDVDMRAENQRTSTRNSASRSATASRAASAALPPGIPPLNPPPTTSTQSTFRPAGLPPRTSPKRNAAAGPPASTSIDLDPESLPETSGKVSIPLYLRSELILRGFSGHEDLGGTHESASAKGKGKAGSKEFRFIGLADGTETLGWAKEIGRDGEIRKFRLRPGGPTERQDHLALFDPQAHRSRIVDKYRPLPAPAGMHRPHYRTVLTATPSVGASSATDDAVIAPTPVKKLEMPRWSAVLGRRDRKAKVASLAMGNADSARSEAKGDGEDYEMNVDDDQQEEEDDDQEASQVGTETEDEDVQEEEDDSESEDELALGRKVKRRAPAPTRRSTRQGAQADRAGKSLKAHGRLTSSSESDISDAGSWASSSSSIRSAHHRPAKRARRTQRSPVTESDEDRKPSLGEEDGMEMYELSESDEQVISEFEEEPSNPGLLFKHKEYCEKCGERPALELYEKAKRKKNGGRRKRDEDEKTDLEIAEELGGWLECTRCCSAYHWKCLPPGKKSEMTRTDALLPLEDRRMPRKWLPIEETIDLQCSRCSEALTKNCYVCHLNTLPAKAEPIDAGGDSKAPDVSLKKEEEDGIEVPPLLFRCTKCKRAAHYVHLPTLEDGEELSNDPAKAARVYQSNDEGDSWHCYDCRRWQWKMDVIIAWRPNPPTAKEHKRPDIKRLLPREYLVTWQKRSFRHVCWVPHDWLANTEPVKLTNFVASGSRLVLDTDSDLAKKKVDGEDQDAFDVMMEVTPTDERRGQDEDEKDKGKGKEEEKRPDPDPEADKKLPVAWSTVDRILGVWVMDDPPKKAKNARKRVDSEDPEDVEAEIHRQRDFRNGAQPDDGDMLTLEKWEATYHRKFTPQDVEEVSRMAVWAFIKWQDLQYNACTRDTPPPYDSALWPAFVRGIKGYLVARQVIVPTLTEKQCRIRDSRKGMAEYSKMEKQPESIVGGTLMDFQLEGLNWLLYKWYRLESCILADDMGLGKTVQIASLLGLLGSDQYHIYPFLVVVPNSTLQNWIREFEKWAPHLRVVPYYGQGDSRDIIRDWELFHQAGKASNSGLKAHVVVTSYEGITMRGDFLALNKIPRWEMLIVDEAQRLKNDKSLIYKRLQQMKVVHKVLLTGTPLNNTVREILNLLHFLDPEAWKDLDGLEKKYAEPDEALFKELRERIAPYLLRRRKDDVLDLPAKNEMIVPLSMRPLQKQVYKSIMEKNADLMEAIARANSKEGVLKKPAKLKQVHNMLMQLRKCAQHPYLNNPSLEDVGASDLEKQQSMIDASAKLAFLKLMLPKLRERGHRVLLFSQFVIALDIIEEFLAGEGFKYLRLDGTTPQAVRQKDIDKFNAPDSDYFIYMLSTRAGGVGINLATADTVIVSDLDFNPHWDMQAIARAHRFGQKKKVLVFRLMMKKSVEETIMQIGKKKLMLDHLIVQTMQKDDDEDFTSILLNGARAILEDSDDQDITYDADAIEGMVKELETREEEKQKTSGFTFAPIYDFKNKKLAELEDEAEEDHAGAADFWKEVLDRANAQRAQAEQEMYGRGARRAAQAANAKLPEQTQMENGKVEASSLRRGSDVASEYAMSQDGPESEGDEDPGVAEEQDYAQLDNIPGGIIAMADGRKKPKGSKKALQLPPAAPVLAAMPPREKKSRSGATEDIPQLLPMDRLTLFSGLGKVQAFAGQGAWYHAAKELAYLLNEIAVRVQVKGHGSLLQNIFDQGMPPEERSKRYKRMAQRIDAVISASGANPVFTTESGLAIADYLFWTEVEIAHRPPTTMDHYSTSAGPSNHTAQIERSAQHSRAHSRSTPSTNGHHHRYEPIVVDDSPEVCGFCQSPHDVSKCPLLLSVDGIEQCIRAVEHGDDDTNDKATVLNYLRGLRVKMIHEESQQAHAAQSHWLEGDRTMNQPTSYAHPESHHGSLSSRVSTCPVCDGSVHPLHKCPVVKGGSGSTDEAMRRLGNHPIVATLKLIRDQQIRSGV